MPFYTRPDLSDIQFKQLTGSTISLSGTTNFVGTLKSKNVIIDASATGATSGDVLTYIGGGRIKLTSGSGASAFNGNRTTTRSGIPAVNVGSTSVNGFLEGYFFPSVPPGAALSGGATRYFGDNSIVNLAYTATRNTLPITSITLDGVAITITNGGNTQSGVTGKTLTTNNTNQTFNLAVKDSSNATANASTTVAFSHKRYFYGDNQNLIGQSDAAITTNVNLHDAGGTAEFASSRVKGSFQVTLSGQFFYYVIPASFGTPLFTINGLSNTDFSSQAFSFTNPFGYVANFVVWRTNNILTGTFTFTVS